MPIKFKVSGFQLIEYDTHVSIETCKENRIGKEGYQPANRRRTNPYHSYDQYNRFDGGEAPMLARLATLARPAELMSWEAWLKSYEAKGGNYY